MRSKKNYAGSAESSFSSTTSAASSRKFSAGPVVSGSDSAPQPASGPFALYPNFQLNHSSIFFEH